MSSRLMRFYLASAAVQLIVFFVGCSGGGTKLERTVSTAGVLTHNGQPLAHYQVIVQPEDGRRPAAGTTNEQGKFVLGTNREDDGAPPGKSKVSAVYVGPPNSGGDGMNSFAPPQPPKVKLAPKYANPETSGVIVEVPPSGTQDLKIELP